MLDLWYDQSFHYTVEQYYTPSCHVAVDTNNGVEAQNKLLKYKFMPRRRHLTLSNVFESAAMQSNSSLS